MGKASERAKEGAHLICSVCIRYRVSGYMLAQVLFPLPLAAILFALGYTLAKPGNALRTNK